MKLNFLNGPRSGETIELTPPGLSIGRETDNDLHILMQGISRYHAKIMWNSGVWTIQDLGSTNGTKINGNLITAPHTLADAQVIGIGDLTIIVRGDAQTVQIPTAPQNVQPAVTFAPADPQPQISFSPAPEQAQAKAAVSFSPAPPHQADIPPSQTTQPAVSFSPAPNQTSHVETEELAQADKNSHAKSFFESFKNASTPGEKASVFGDNLFKKNSQSGDSANASGNPTSASSRRSNLIFYTLVICAAVVFIAVFMHIQQKPVAAPPPTQQKNEDRQFLLVYDKQIVAKDNVFRFSLTIENGSAVFTLDDIKSKRHYQKAVKEVKASFLRDLEDKIRKTTFMELQPESPGIPQEGTDDSRTIIVALGRKMNKITVKNTFPKSSFEEVENAIDEFAELYGLRSISMTPEEMKSAADSAFYKAEDLFQNYEARPENLKEAIKRYQVTIEYLEQFVPKPEIWNTARKKQQEAQAILDNKIKDLKFNIVRYIKLAQIQEARSDASKIMSMLDPDNKDYEYARTQKIKFDKYLNSLEKK